MVPQIDSFSYVDELGRGESGVFGVNGGPGDSKSLGRLVNRNTDQHNHFMGKKDPKVGSHKNNQFITVEPLEPSDEMWLRRQTLYQRRTPFHVNCYRCDVFQGPKSYGLKIKSSSPLRGREWVLASYPRVDF